MTTALPVTNRFRADAGVQAVEEYLAAARSVSQVAVLRCFRDHLAAEMRSDVEGTLATMVDDPEFTFYAEHPPGGPKGHAAVWEFYAGLFRSRWFTHWAIDNILVAGDSLFVEGWHHAILRAEHMAMLGLTCDRDEVFRRTNRVGVVCRFVVDGAHARLCGERSYFLPPVSAHPTVDDFAPVLPDELDVQTT